MGHAFKDQMIMALFVLHKLILQTSMRSHPVGLDVWFFVGSFVYFHTSCVWTAKALARLRRCTGSPEPSLVAYVIDKYRNLMSWLKCHFLSQLTPKKSKYVRLTFHEENHIWLIVPNRMKLLKWQDNEYEVMKNIVTVQFWVAWCKEDAGTRVGMNLEDSRKILEAQNQLFSYLYYRG